MTNPLALDGVMAGLVSKLDAAVAWLTEIEDERRTAMRQIDDLRAAIRALAQLMPEGQADRYLAGMTKAAPPRTRPGPPIGRTERMAAVMHVLATHPSDTIRTGELQRYLTGNALAKDNRAAARALAKKAKQGIVEKLDWGRYRIIRDHPELVRVRENAL